MEKEICERIEVDDGTLVINRHYMALETLDGVLHPADLDKYGQYQPILDLIRLISCNADMSCTVTEKTQEMLMQALLGKHECLSCPLIKHCKDVNRTTKILNVIRPTNEDDFTRALCFIYADGPFDEDAFDYCFSCREDLREYLGKFMDDDHAYNLSEVVRKGELCNSSVMCPDMKELYKDQLALLPQSVVDGFSKTMYLPKKSVVRYIMRYAIWAANSLDKNNNCIITYRQ